MATKAVAAADLDLDGNLDLVLANGFFPHSVTFAAALPGGGWDIEITSAATTTAQPNSTNVMAARSGQSSVGLLAFPALIFPGWSAIPPHALVTDARLTLLQRNPFTVTRTYAAATLDLHQNTVAFNAQTETWNSWWFGKGRAPTEPTPAASISLPQCVLTAPGVERSITVTALAQSWVGDPGARDRGLTLSGTASVAGIFLASDLGTPLPHTPFHPPRLEIDYLDAANTILVNGGAGYFTDASAARLPPRSKLLASRAVAVGDLDGDGGPDLVFANENAPPELLHNRGADRTDPFAGFFEDWSARLPASLGPGSAVVLLDADGDGSMDIFLAASGAPATLLMNAGFGASFDDESAARLPPDALAATAAASADLDGDGAPDLVIATAGPTAGVIWLNDGRGHFSDASSALAGTLSKSGGQVLLGDLNGDGRRDIVIADPDRSGWPVALMGLGRGRFQDISYVLPAGAAAASAVVSGRFDGDAVPDLFFCGPGGTRALLLTR